MLAGLLTLVLLSADPIGADTLVVCPREFLPALDPWLAHREAQGHRLRYLPSSLSAQQIRDSIRHLARGGNLQSILLVGDAEPGAELDATLRKRCLPAPLATALVNVHFGSEP